MFFHDVILRIAFEFKIRRDDRAGLYSGSAGLLNSTVNLMLPWPNCGKPSLVWSPGSRLDAVSSGGNNTSELRNVCSATCSPLGKPAYLSRDACASPPWRRVTSCSVMLRPSCPYGPVEP